MRHLILNLFALLSLSNILAQNKNDFSIELNVNGSNHNMGFVNQYFTKFFDSKYSVGPAGKSTLDLGMDYGIGIHYQPFNFMDFGVFGNYQSSAMKRSFTYKEVFDPVNYPDSAFIRNGSLRNETSAFSIGISSNLYINKLLHLDQKESVFARNVIISLGLKGGIGFSSFEEKSEIDYITNTTLQYTKLNATNFNGRAELGIGYPICNKSFFSQIGIKIGYQYFKTSSVKNYADEYLYYYNRKVSLDFSGIYYGVYLKFGKH